MFKHSEAFSFQVATNDQAETDRLWNAVVGNGGQESACGWYKAIWGTWQGTPCVLTAAITHPEPASAKRAFKAMRGSGMAKGLCIFMRSAGRCRHQVEFVPHGESHHLRAGAGQT